jgi:hypothetical protein
MDKIELIRRFDIGGIAIAIIAAIPSGQANYLSEAKQIDKMRDAYPI